jgi:MarR family transcriptional regulator, organic hydroperoxide resistance regulator
VQGERDTEDERQVRIRLTKAGLALKETARAIAEAILCATGRPRPELRGLNEQLLRLRDQLNEAETPTAR